MNNMNTEISLSEAEAYVKAVVKQSGSSFYLALRVLPAEKRKAMFAVYAFCRKVDDIADGGGSQDEKLARLAHWRGEIERLYGAQPRIPVTVALVGPVEQYGLRKEDFRAVIDGMEMDVADTLRMEDMDELTLYCDRVACAVGRLSNRVFGIDEEMGEKVAVALGHALQLTNILRDIHEDASRDRLYLPKDVLASYGIENEDVKVVLNHRKLPDVCSVLATIAEQRFDEAARLLKTCDRRKMRPAIMMMAGYQRILSRLISSGWSSISRPVKLRSWDKLWMFFRYGVG